jgi:hypothetical protein
MVSKFNPINPNPMRIHTQILVLALFALFSRTAQAQPGGGRFEEKIKSLRIAYFTEKLSLTPDEAKVFWPVYDGYADEMDVVRKKTRMMRKDVKWNFDTMTDKDLSDMADEYLDLRRKEYEITNKYASQFKSVLSPRKLVLFYKADNEFSVWLIKKIREMRGEAAGE